MATLEDAAEQLVVKLKGLDSEIEESQHALEQGRQRVEEMSRDVDEEWSALAEAVSSLLEKLREEQQQLAGDAEEALEASTETRGAVHEAGSEARSEVADGAADVEVLAQRASGLEPGVESIVAEAGEVPARSLAERAKEVEDQLAEVLQGACEFLRDDVVGALNALAESVEERCQALRASIVDETVGRLEELFTEWEASVDELEGYVSAQGFVASHSHARAVVEWALTMCTEACDAQLEAASVLTAETARQLQALVAEVPVAGGILAGEGAALMAATDGTLESATNAIRALGAVKDLLASFSFVQV